MNERKTKMAQDEIFSMAKAAAKYANNPHKWLQFLEAAMKKRGYEYMGLECCCENGGEFGHEFYCGWGKSTN